MTDTRIEDRRKAGWSDREILASIRSGQEGSQIWMNRTPDAIRSVNGYLGLADYQKSLYTPAELAWLSTKEAADRYLADPVSFLAVYARY